MTTSPYVPDDPNHWGQPKKKVEKSSHIPGVTSPPPRWKERDDMTADELFQYAKDGKPVESDAYKEFRDEALKDAGITDDDDRPRSLDEMSPGELYGRMVKR